MKRRGLGDPWLSRVRLTGRSLGSENEWPVGPDDGVAGVLASWLPRSEVTLAYPGLRLEAGTYATHGHYLDLHLTVPRVESLMASAVYRLTGRSDCTSAADYEAVMGPIYGFHAGLSEGATGAAYHNRAHGARSSGAIDRIGYALDDILGEGVQLLGAVQGDDGHAAALFVQHYRFGHERVLSRLRKEPSRADPEGSLMKA